MIDLKKLAEQRNDLAIHIDQRFDHYEEDDAVNESLLGILEVIDAVLNGELK